MNPAARFLRRRREMSEGSPDAIAAVRRFLIGVMNPQLLLRQQTAIRKFPVARRFPPNEALSYISICHCAEKQCFCLCEMARTISQKHDHLHTFAALQDLLSIARIWWTLQRTWTASLPGANSAESEPLSAVSRFSTEVQSSGEWPVEYFLSPSPRSLPKAEQYVTITHSFNPHICFTLLAGLL